MEAPFGAKVPKKGRKVNDMKRLKKALALALALTVVMAFSGLSVFAETGDMLTTPESTITATEVTAGDSVSYYQLVEWKNGNWALTELGTTAGVSLDNLTNGINEAEATTIAKNLAEASATGSMTAGDPATTFTASVQPGLYYLKAVPGNNNKDTVYNPAFVSADYYEGGNEVSFNNTIGDSTVVKKSTVPFNKVVTSTDKYVDTKPEDVIPFKISTTIPSYGTSFENPVFTITDTLSEGLTLEGDITVKYGESTTTETVSKVVTITKGTPSNGFTVAFDKEYLSGLEGGTPDVEITYSAKVTTAGTNNVTYMDNKAKLTFSNKPGETVDKDKKTRHYTFAIDGNLLGSSENQTKELIKTGTDKDGNPVTEEKTFYGGAKGGPLAGAGFTLYAENGTTVIATTDSKADGRINFNGLDAGTYKLKETTVPAGYVGDTRMFTVKIIPTYDEHEPDLLKSYKVEISAEESGSLPAVSATTTFSMTNDGGVTVSSSEGNHSSLINNTQGKDLPSTGGIGTTIFYIVGAILVVGAGILLIARRRMAAK